MIWRIAKFCLVFSLLAGVLEGCIVVGRPAVPCPGAIWIEGHNDRYGRWHRAHWRCPGVVEEEIIIR